MGFEIDSPPYPGEGATTALLYNYIAQLRDWTAAARAEIHRLTGAEILPKMRPMPRQDVYLSQPLGYQAQHLKLLRTVREQWDAVLRSHEHDWDSVASLRGRILVVGGAVAVVNAAYVSPEVREAKASQLRDDIQRAMEGAAGTFDRLMREAGHGEREVFDR